MTKLTWLGPDDYEAGETPPHSLTWNGITFPVGVAVEVDHPVMIAKAKGNRMFKVEDGDAVNLASTPGRSDNENGGISSNVTQWREPTTEADPADVSFFDDPPGVETPLDMPPDYPPEEEPERKPGKPRAKVKPDGSRQ